LRNVRTSDAVVAQPTRRKIIKQKLTLRNIAINSKNG
jgi:hypothetical protein